MIIDSRYEVIEQLGTSLWATVYKVIDVRTEEVFALKLFQNIEAETLYHRFSAEDMHHITKIDHPNLIHVSNFGNSGKHIYYVSEFCPGRSLQHFIFQKTHLDFFYDIIVQICYGLNALHRQNIVHKDLKPDNIMYVIENEKPSVKILDYGFTKIDMQKKQQKISGTLPYVAPEIYLGKGALPQSDFYSLGVTLYKITTGTLPISVEQITNLISGKTHGFFPKFPRELNPDIPIKLEKLILRLLETKPENRFKDAASIIAYINRIQLKTYAFSLKRSIVNNIKFSSYIVREKYAHQLLDYVPMVEKSNGKVIVIIGGKGLGKENFLSLFRYHILTDKYFVFDYTCSEHDKDPFFALIKEFYNYLKSQDVLSDELKNISKKFHKYLFESEEEADKIISENNELELDFQMAEKITLKLSEIKPLIFVIRAGQYLTKDTIDFVNHISNQIMFRPILIILSINNPSIVQGLIHPVQIKIDTLSFNETKEYINKLLGIEPPELFIRSLWLRTNGNPSFIRDTLIDLTDRKLIWKDDRFFFDFDFSNYELSSIIKASIFNRMSHLHEISYKYLRILSIVNTPISKSLIRFLMDITEKELFFFLRNALNNEILVERDEYYYFSFLEAKKKFLEENSEKTKIETSKRVLEYFSNQIITKPYICKGIIKNALAAKDFRSVRKYKLLLISIYQADYKQEKAFTEIKNVLELDFSKEIVVETWELKQDLDLFLELTDITGSFRIGYELIKSNPEFPEIFEKYYLLGNFQMNMEEYSKAEKLFEKALDMAITGKKKVETMIHLSWLYAHDNKMAKAKIILDKIENYELSICHKIAFIDRKGIYLGLKGKYLDAANLIEDFLPTITAQKTTKFYIVLGRLYNNLAFLYSALKMIDQSDKHFHNAKRLWEKVNYRNSLPTVYNNIGDLAIRKGDIKPAFDYFERAYKICLDIGQVKGQALALLNFGEGYIKIGNFKEAEKYLMEAEKLVVNMENQPFLNSIQNNLALTKFKLDGFNNYYAYISRISPELFDYIIIDLTPLTKTYFYYLFNTGQHEKVKILLQKNLSINLPENHEEEFYYHVQGMLKYAEGDMESAIQNFQIALEYSIRNKSAYAQTILNIRLAESYITLNNTLKVKEHYRRAYSFASKYNFMYWLKHLKIIKCKIDLLSSDIPLRQILRELFQNLNEITVENYYLLKIYSLHLIIQIYLELKAEKKAGEFFNKLIRELDYTCKEIPQEDKDHFFQKMNCAERNFDDFCSGLNFSIAPRSKVKKGLWEEDLYDLLKLKEVERIKFFINRLIRKFVSPFAYCIILSDGIKLKNDAFLSDNFSIDKFIDLEMITDIEKSVEVNHIVRKKMGHHHVIIVPLGIKNARVGVMILLDDGELEFRSSEITIIKSLRLHLSSILTRIQEFAELNNQMNLITKLMRVTRQFFTQLDINKLELEFVSFSIEFTNARRGFLIKRNQEGNYQFQVAMDSNKQFLRDIGSISKTVLSEVQNARQAIYTYNAKVDNAFKNSISVQDYDLHAIYCAPLIIDNQIYGYLYLDDFDSDGPKMLINKMFMEMLIIQISIAMKNAVQYKALMAKNWELHTLDQLKDDFLSIVSHELNTPLVTLSGQINRLKRNKQITDDNSIKTISKIEKSIKRLSITTTDIVHLNRYKMAKDLKKDLIDIADILEIIIEEAKIISAKRNMIINLELENNLPEIELNWEAFHLMVYNIVLNAIRFTKDFGTIIIGARRSAFQMEEIDGKSSIVIYVQDDGLGIPEHELKNIFKSFYEVKDIYSHKSGLVEYNSSGLGIGLTTAKRIVDLHHGKIWINSKEREGTTVFIALPVGIHQTN